MQIFWDLTCAQTWLAPGTWMSQIPSLPSCLVKVRGRSGLGGKQRYRDNTTRKGRMRGTQQ